MNILITSCGRRSYIVEYFKEALKKCGGGEVHCVNSDPISTCVPGCDKFTVSPSIYDVGYVEYLLKYCKENKISMIIPVFDIDVPVLSSNKERFLSIGTFVVCSDIEFSKLCRDKYKMAKFLESEGINCPEMVVGQELGKTLPLPIIVKPRAGMGSLETYIAETPDEVLVFGKKAEKKLRENYLKYESKDFFDTDAVCFQKYVKGEEYNLDIVSDFEGNFVTCVVKEKLRMRSGETDAAKVVYDEKLFKLGEKLQKIFSKLGKVVGDVDVDIIMSENIPYVIDVNPRFGGGYPFAQNSGMDLPLAMIMWRLGEKPDESLFRVNYGNVFAKAISIVKI